MDVCRSVGSTMSSLTMASPTIPSDGTSGKSITPLRFGTISIESVVTLMEYDQKPKMPELVRLRQ